MNNPMISRVEELQSHSQNTTSLIKRYYDIQALNLISLSTSDMTISHNFSLVCVFLVWLNIHYIDVVLGSHWDFDLQLFIAIFLIWNGLINFFNLIFSLNLQRHSSRLEFWINWCFLGNLLSFCHWAWTLFKLCSLWHSQFVLLRKLYATWLCILILRAIILFNQSNNSFTNHIYSLNAYVIWSFDFENFFF